MVFDALVDFLSGYKKTELPKIERHMFSRVSIKRDDHIVLVKFRARDPVSAGALQKTAWTAVFRVDSRSLSVEPANQDAENWIGLRSEAFHLAGRVFPEMLLTEPLDWLETG